MLAPFLWWWKVFLKSDLFSVLRENCLQFSECVAIRRHYFIEVLLTGLMQV